MQKGADTRKPNSEGELFTSKLPATLLLLKLMQKGPKSWCSLDPFIKYQIRHLRKKRRVVLKYLSMEEIEEEISISLSPSVL